MFHPLKHLLLLAATDTPVDVFLADAMAAERGAERRTHSPGRPVGWKKHGNGTGIDTARDAAALVEATRAVRELLLSPDRPERITPAAVARRTSYRTLIQTPRGRIPRTTAYVRSVVEDLPSIRRRRLAWVAGRYAAEGVVPYAFQLFERAGLLRRESPGLEHDAAEHIAWIMRLAGTSGRVNDNTPG